MAFLFANNASTTIVGSIGPTDTQVNVAAGTGVEFPHPTLPADYFCATFYDAATGTVQEIVHVTSITADTMTMVRAQEGTVARSWMARAAPPAALGRIGNVWRRASIPSALDP